MLTERQAAQLSIRVQFGIIDYSDRGKFDMNNIVEDLPLDQFMDKLEMCEPDWYTFARLDCE